MMEDKVLSIEKMQHLKKLGVNTDNASAVLMLYTENGKELGWDEVENHGKDKPLYEWYDAETETWEPAHIRIYDAEMGDYDHSYREECGTFTLQDMLEMMPNRVKGFDLVLFRDNHIQYEKWDGITQAKILVQFDGKNLLEVAYKILCWLAENKLLGKEEDK